MPARSKSQQRLFGMVHAYQKGKLKNAPEQVKEIARSISDEDAEHFAKTKHKGLPEKKASVKIDIPAIYDEVRRAYADMGYPVSGDRLSVSEQPTYTNGKSVPADVLSSNESGGNTQDDGTVRINPRYRSVMRHWGLKGPGRDFLRTIIGHELGHHIDKSVLSKPERAEERKRLLKEIVNEKFHTVYTDSYGPDTDPRKLDKELLAEYLAAMVRRKLEKKAVSFSRDGSTFQLATGETPGHAVKAWNSANPDRKITMQHVLSANPKVKATRYRIGTRYSTGLATVAPAPKKPVAAPASTRAPATAPAAKAPATAQPTAQRPEGTPIGYWNNNPGNLVSDGRTDWDGIRQILPKGKNMEFNDYGSGYRAMSRILYNYGAKHGIDTPLATVSRFAKSAPAAKKTEYANFLKSKTGWGPNDKIDLTKEDTLQKLVPSMASFEIGPAWTAKHDPSVVSNAVTRAIPPK
jgi:hypothetical protein